MAIKKSYCQTLSKKGWLNFCFQINDYDCICITFYINNLKQHQNMLYVSEHNNAVNTNNSSLKYHNLLKTTSFFPRNIK